MKQKWIPKLVKSGPEEKERKRTTQKFQNHWFPICFRSVLYRGGGDGGGGALPPFPYTPLWFCENPEILSNRKGFYYCFGMVSVKPKGGTWNWQPGQGGAVLYWAPKMSPGTSLNLGQIALHMLLVKRLPPRSQETFRSFCHLCGKRCTGKPLYNIPSRLSNPSC